MIRWKFTFDKDDEQDWINEYCQQGWAMAGFFVGVVTFVPCQPGEFIYQIDLLPGRGLCAGDYEGYVEFMHDTGVEVLQRWGRWVYLRRRAEEGFPNRAVSKDSLHVPLGVGADSLLFYQRLEPVVPVPGEYGRPGTCRVLSCCDCPFPAGHMAMRLESQGAGTAAAMKEEGRQLGAASLVCLVVFGYASAKKFLRKDNS